MGRSPIVLYYEIENTARRQTNILDDEQSDIRGFSHFIASSGELPRTYSVRLVCITNLATSATRGFSFTHFFFCLRALFSTLNYILISDIFIKMLFQLYMQWPIQNQLILLLWLQSLSHLVFHGPLVDNISDAVDLALSRRSL